MEGRGKNIESVYSHGKCEQAVAAVIKMDEPVGCCRLWLRVLTWAFSCILGINNNNNIKKEYINMRLISIE